MRIIYATSAVWAASVVFFCGMIRNVDGQANILTSYTDPECREMTSSNITIFGVQDFASSTQTSFNECLATEGMGSLTVCDTTTGATGTNTYEDGTCTEIVTEGAALPACVPLEGDCSGSFCFTMSECTDVEPLAISPNAFNFITNEFDDADCTEPTGKTEILSRDVFPSSFADGTCTAGSPSAMSVTSECSPDGSYVFQNFAPNDSTCSGEVWVQGRTSTDTSDACSTLEFGGKFYSAVSCTMAHATIGVGGTASPVMTPPSLSTGTDDFSGMMNTPAPSSFGPGY